ncbi:exonuclease 3'-5' domain-containing protein 2-like isoform X2 [Portunus trituberculatus]|uniref:exonuclease 3'-5' domain-containing protein 2-like isoform X2 n=1 Tax=Portunus trituberculatus TaxID=210409 RepID=UPI001E1CBF6F|nr:exonuclease 3'-5' domain-containing protein 2-like isoform X2 [Portunus trituberculatus]
MENNNNNNKNRKEPSPFIETGMMWMQPSDMWTLVAGLGGVMMLLAGLYLKMLPILMRKRVAVTLWFTSQKVWVVTSPLTWERVFPQLHREAIKDGAIGLDCEWVQVKGSRRPVALLQLATSSGLCVLVRLSHLKGITLLNLEEFLRDDTVLKVGVGTIEDSDYLYQDYKLQVQGCIDLRHLVLLKEENEGGHHLGLSALAKTFLGITLDKDWRVRASDWEADTLSKRQEKYAADDALVGIQLLMVLVGELLGRSEGASSSLLPLLLPAFWQSHLAKAIHQICHNYKDLKFSTKNQDTALKSGVAVKAAASPRKQKDIQPTTRKGPLYYNCQLLAPDNQPLCTLDPKKAQWYVVKGLGHLVSEDPLIVRLNFEPTGRPQAEREDGEFYLQERLNVCVVCGQKDSYIRKNVVPHEYRKHFPSLLKHHQNHDVLLLCFPCHRKSNMLDAQLRMQLGKEFQAPVGNDPNAKDIIDNSRKQLRNAARALLRHRGSLPEVRVQEYQYTLQQFFCCESLTEEQLKEAANMEVKVHRGQQEHGQAVVEGYKMIGLSKLEQRWRQHFINMMEPHFLPECWSVTHNMYKMKLKMARLPLDHKDRLLYKMALVGTEGTIEVPYNPRVGRDESPSYDAFPVTEKGNRILITPGKLVTEKHSKK